ncbi:MAG: helix-hairpin-helix domain-containing protein, partial [Gammaproteobacteria bacterium]|nr:helix-hairpin-helix domain-containing protein [Gammaproteobacteria bacterium]
MTCSSNTHTAYQRNSNACLALQTIPGIGKNLCQDLLDLGYSKVTDLKGQDPETMYQNLISLRGRHMDRCVLYVFRCAVYYASNDRHDPELL